MNSVRRLLYGARRRVFFPSSTTIWTATQGRESSKLLASNPNWGVGGAPSPPLPRSRRRWLWFRKCFALDLKQPTSETTHPLVGLALFCLARTLALSFRAFPRSRGKYLGKLSHVFGGGWRVALI